MFGEKLNFRDVFTTVDILRIWAVEDNNNNNNIPVHCQINMAYKMSGLIKRNFTYLSIPSFVLVYKNLEYNWIIVTVCGIRMESTI